ncbi:Asp-tRNA(Asn)/Glu-tRNA(Gln) amidotransferase subunit GatA [Gloeobacter violaceus]|uniref:Glutamyl-tRNA(Gln) amidotransferase subunit A n=1 Tax=Gloeobacter violaceus (strain ATCC 29082 / PCC 7421) TaxID=251221 RepID=GATA_GLOVI|nr:Asp-tRNA(Asn)/Glu-tRNA(Gln) amidotransferase subunit GatA [Gloeobacter violaceus]Q7NKF0.1 RecName: Full=Glutamyl-tRNA(Gln) amidotransferase subunit A; Short=Glu-ADT subunit A [Gloeobacter violaceus PCC 7421]BAC89469.1 glutamyl-tRNA(Gln) amidotransferase subunit A [Gloeobacter violaceus PCC 7421]
MTSIGQLRSQVASKERSAVEVARQYLERAERLDTEVHAFLRLTPERALAAAEAVDAKIARGEDPGLLAGVPVAVKDNLCMVGIPTTCASKILENYRPPYESTVTRRLEEQGALIIGKTNLDEFAMGSSTENSAFGPTRNPWDLGRVPGGSSGGSAAAVAACEAVASLGSDTGGSIRQPASFCGVVGLKPTYGLVSRYGLIAFASSLDQIGPFTRTVEDAALVLQAIAGHDPLDSTSLAVNVPDYRQALISDLKGVKVGFVKEFFAEGLDPDVADAVFEAIEVMRDLGAQIQEVSCPRFARGLSTYYIIATSEASANLARYDGVKYGLRDREADALVPMYGRTREEGFGSEVKRRIMLGTYALSAGYYDAYYLKAQKVRTLIKQDYLDAFAKVDVLVGPTAPTTAFAFGDKVSDPLSMYLSDIYTIPLNLAGVAGASIPCGFDAKGLPIGFQIMANALEEGKLLRAAYAYEQATEWHKRTPALAAEALTR